MVKWFLALMGVFWMMNCTIGYAAEREISYQVDGQKVVGTLTIRKTLCDTISLQEEKRRLESEMVVLVDMVNNCIAENAHIAQDQEEYQKRYDGMVAKYDAAKTKFDETIAAISAKEAQSARLTAFVKALRERDGIIEDFDESLWGCRVEHITVGRNKGMTVGRHGYSGLMGIAAQGFDSVLFFSLAGITAMSEEYK